MNHGVDAINRLEMLAGLANTRLSFIETIQVDAALSKIPHTSNSRFEDVKTRRAGGEHD